MAEILVSDLCDLSPAAAHRRVFRCREERGPLVHCFWIVSACFSRCSLLFRVDCLFSRDYKVLCCIFADFRPVDRLYFLWAKILTRFSRLQAMRPCIFPVLYRGTR